MSLAGEASACALLTQMYRVYRVVEACWETTCNRCGEVLSSYFLNADLTVENIT